jgi:mycothiol synthase
MTLRWRPVEEADCAAWAGLLNEVERADDTGEHYDEADLAEELADPNLDARRDTVGVWAADRMVGYGMVRGASGVLAGQYRVHVEGAVAPAHRRQGVGRQILAWLLERAAAVHAERHPEAAGSAEVRGADTNRGLLALIEAEGFQPQRWFSTMTRDLAGPPPPARVPAGMLLVPYAGAHSEATRLAHNEAFADHWGFTPRDEQDWGHWGVGQRAFRPQVSFLLLDGPQVAAYLLSYEYEADTAATGVREAYVGVLGTRRPWRGRGAARALLCRAVAAYAEAGYHRTSLDVDSANPTGALGLYRSVGYTVGRTSVSYTRPLTGHRIPSVVRR